MKNKNIAGIVVIVILTVGTAAAMPMSSCTHEQAAEIMLQPIKDDIAAHRAALVAGDITTEEYMTYLTITKAQIEFKVMLLDILLESNLKANEFGSALFDILPWNIR